jgi:hypothetical protein
MQFTPTGLLSNLTKELIERESKQFAKREKLLKATVQLSKELDVLWKYVQRKHEKFGRPIIRHDMEIASKVMVHDGTMENMALILGLNSDASYFEIMLAIDKLGKDISQYARQAIYLFGHTDSMSP